MIYTEKNFFLKASRLCTLRSAAPSDAAAMIEFLRISNEETYFMMRYPEEITLTEEEETTILKNWEAQPNKLLLLALIDGEIVGSCGITPVAEHLKTQHRGRFGISVKQDYWVYSDNLRAQKLYERFGFTEWGRLPNAYKLKDGSYRDEINMALTLNDD